MSPIGFAYPARGRRSVRLPGFERGRLHHRCDPLHRRGDHHLSPSATPRAQEPARLRVALDATPLLGLPTGVGAFCQGALAALGLRPGLDVRAYAVSWRRRRQIESQLPPGVRVRQRPMPARPLHASWGRRDGPPLEWFIGATDVVHGTNFLVPPTSRAAAVVSVHDLTPLHHPELCNEATLAYPGLIRRAVGRGAWVHTDSAFVADEVHGGIRRRPVPRPRRQSRHSGAARSRPRLRPMRCCFGSCRRASGASAWPSARRSRARTCRDWCAPSTAVAGQQPDVALVLAGPPGWGEQALEAAIDAATARDRIVRTGWVTQADLAALLARASVLAYPSLYEGFGFPPLQAMQAGVPVVATRAGSLPEVLGRRRRCWSSPATTTVWSRRSLACLGDEEERRPPHRRGHGVVGPVFVGALWRRTRGALSRCGGRPWLSRRPLRCCSRSSSCGGACPAASAPTPAACSVAWPPVAAEGDGVEVALLASRAPPGGGPIRWPRSAGRCARRACRAGS